MRECWLKPNRRAILAGLCAPAVALAAGIALGLAFQGSAGLRYLAWLGWCLAAIGALGAGALLVLLNQPRLGFAAGHLVVYLGTPRPLRVPIDLVECFFLGTGPSLLPPSGGKEFEASTIVVRLAESATEWRHKDVRPALGHWCDGYIVIRGTWCEPISPELVQRLNGRLVEAHRRERKARELETA